MRRLPLAALTAIVLAGASLAACEWRVTEIDASDAPITCSLPDVVPPALPSGPFWGPSATAVTLRFGVVNADVDEPLSVSWWYPSFAPTTAPPTTVVPQRVWDGHQATGFVTFGAAPHVGIALRTDTGRPVSGHVSWTLTALDASGRDVGFLTCRPHPEPA